MADLVNEAAEEQESARHHAKATEEVAVGVEPGAEAGVEASLLGKTPKRGGCDCGPARGTWRARLREIVTSDGFGHGSTGMVLLNVVLMCMPYASQSDGYSALLETLGNIISVIFMVEMTLKLTGLGCSDYWADG